MKFRCRWIVLLFLLVSSARAAEPDWRLYDALLSAYTSEESREGITLTWVDYSALAQDERFEQLVAQLEGFPLARLESPQEFKAFYINAYNILALKTVVDHWPLASIKDAGSWFRPVWYRRAGTLGGEPVTLNQIEHEVLRPLGDPRIHMAIVCASLSCPDLRAEAYRAARLDAQLDDQTRHFLSNPDKGVRFGDSTVQLSQIFDWFEGDFAAAGGVSSWIGRYLEPALPESYRFLPYHWEVNGS